MVQKEGLGFEEDVLIRKVRRIPAKGKVFVSVGDVVRPETVVASCTVVNPEVHEVRVDIQLDVDPSEVERYMLKKEGDEVKRNEAIAVHRSFFGRSTKVCRSPIDGTIEMFSGSSGRVLIRGKPILIEVKAHISGKVAEVIPSEGAVIECRAATIQGRFGVGGETLGELAVVVDEPAQALTTELITDEHKGKILVGGSVVTLDALHRAAKIGVSGIVVGGVDQKDLTDFLGYEVGMGVTGKEKTGLTLIITEGFGAHPMEEGAFNLLRACEGKRTSIDGSTQIRARILRPEVIVPS